MWPFLFCIRQTNSAITDTAETFFETLNGRLPLEHASDQREKQNVSYLLANINDPKYRGQVVYFARLLAHKDGELHPNEEKLLERMRLTVTDGLDMDAIREDVRGYVGGTMVEHEANIDSNRPDSGLFGLFDRFIVWCGIDLMDE